MKRKLDEKKIQRLNSMLFLWKLILWISWGYQKNWLFSRKKHFVITKTPENYGDDFITEKETGEYISKTVVM